MRKQIDPSEYDDEQSFLDDCVAARQDENPDESESDALDACAIAWDERAAGGSIIRKTHLDEGAGLEFVMSDETRDRLDDIIMSDGWLLDDFRKSPTALFGHKSDFIIGRWKNVRVVNKQLRGTLELAKKGTSPRVNEVISLVEQGLLRAVSVGFKAKESEPLDKDNPFGGRRFIKQELVETSLVSIPANPNALLIARGLKVSDDTMRLVFARHGDGHTSRAVARRIGKQAATQPTRKTKPMTLAQRIQEAERRLVSSREKLAAHLEAVDDNNVTDAQMQTTHDLNDEVAKGERGLALLRDSERHLGETSDDGGRAIIVAPATRAPAGASARPLSLGPRKQLSGLDLLVRAGVIQYFAHIKRRNVDDIRREIYGDDEPTRAILDYSMKAATAPAMTTVTGWAAELVQTIHANFMESLQPKSVFPRLSAKGLSLSFGRSGKIAIPTRASTPTVAGSFVGEGLPIPVRQAGFTSQTLVPKKMAVITTWTREIDEHSIPAIEGLLRNAISEDTAVSLDAVLLDNVAATAVRPAGILNGVAALTATTGGGFTALVGDIKQISGALLTATNGNVRSPCWLMNPQQVMTAGLTPAPGVGAFPFQDQVNSGNLQGWPIIDSGSVPLGRVIAIDAADFVVAGGDAPRFELSDSATLHFEDTSPADIGSPGTPPVVASPVKNLWQTDSIALRLILPVNWALRRSGVVAWVNGVTW